RVPSHCLTSSQSAQSLPHQQPECPVTASPAARVPSHCLTSSQSAQSLPHQHPECPVTASPAARVPSHCLTSRQASLSCSLLLVQKLCMTHEALRCHVVYCHVAAVLVTHRQGQTE
ncbi:hypothetical protein LSAT2_019289, partial [Lamellibrachia satsuma]